MAGGNTYADRVQRAVGHLAEHLDEPFDLEALASVAHFSPYHFHRVYRGLLGETVHDTIRRLRLHRSAVDLLDRDMPIERVAGRAGYSSQAAFTRAFRAEYGAPPARYRASRHSAKQAATSDAAACDVHIVTLEPLRAAAVDHVGDYQLTSKAFEKLMTIAIASGLLSAETRAFGIYFDDPAAVPVATLRSAACITIPGDLELAAGLRDVPIAGGRYARIIHTGPYAELRHVYDWLYGTWLVASGEELRDLPCLEEYLNDPRQVPAKELQTAVLMPVETTLEGDAV